MITLDSVTLKSWLEENSSFLTGARIQKIQQPTRREFVFTLRNSGETRKLYINIDPQFFHVCFMTQANEEKRLIEIPQKPPMFCMLLRKYIENARVSKVNQPEFERILEFYIETYNELSEKIYLCLAIELMGKHSNVVLYNYDTNIIIGCAHNVGAEKSREREMAGGLPYVYPPKQNNFWYAAENSLSNLSGSVNSNIDNYFADCIYGDKFRKLQEKYCQIVSKRLKRIQNSLAKMSKQRVSVEKADKYRLHGDLIMANLYNNSDFVPVITVFDYENNKNISVELDETKTLKENANRFYKLYNKAKTSNQKLFELTQGLNIEKDYLEQLLYSIKTAENVSDLREVSQEVEPEKAVSKDKKSAILPIEIKTDDYTIFIGKNNKQNDYIVSKLAKDDDMWFHTRDCAGSHVLLKADKKTDELILKCAKLAKENSSGAKSSKIGVIYTYAKYLKKPPKSNLGYVTYSHEKEIVID